MQEHGLECNHPSILEQELVSNPDNTERMLIRVILPNNEEGFFNADCSVALLLDTIKKRHQIARQDIVDLCSVDGAVKHLSSHLSDTGTTFCEPRATYIVVKVISIAEESGTSVSSPTYVPALSEYSNDEEFMAALNVGVEDQHSSGHGKGHKRSGNPSSHRTVAHSLKPPTPDGGKSKSGKGRRRGSIMK